MYWVRGGETERAWTRTVRFARLCAEVGVEDGHCNSGSERSEDADLKGLHFLDEGIIHLARESTANVKYPLICINF
jgi:hypothetical protein